MNKNEILDQLFDERGDLLDTKAIAAINERPFYLQSKLDELDEQIRLVATITEQAQAAWLDSGEFPQSPRALPHRWDERTPELQEADAVANAFDFGKIEEINF